MTTCTLIHYPVTSDNPWFDGSLIFYRGDDYFIEPHETVVLVPCQSADPEHWKSSKNSCKLLTSSTFQQPENVLKRRFSRLPDRQHNRCWSAAKTWRFARSLLQRTTCGNKSCKLLLALALPQCPHCGPVENGFAAGVLTLGTTTTTTMTKPR